MVKVPAASKPSTTRTSRVYDDQWRIPNVLWERIEPLLPARPPHPLGCHNPRVPDRKAMDTIFFVLRTGCQWNALNVTGICSSSCKASVNPSLLLGAHPYSGPSVGLTSDSGSRVPWVATLRCGYEVSGVGISSSLPHARRRSGSRFHGRNPSTSSVARPPALAHASR